jgi:hypothetical protein
VSRYSRSGRDSAEALLRRLLLRRSAACSCSVASHPPRGPLRFAVRLTIPSCFGRLTGGSTAGFAGLLFWATAQRAQRRQQRRQQRRRLAVASHPPRGPLRFAVRLTIPSCFGRLTGGSTAGFAGLLFWATAQRAQRRQQQRGTAADAWADA